MCGVTRPREISGGKDHHAKATTQGCASGARRCHTQWHRAYRSVWRWCGVPPARQRSGPARLRSSVTSISTTTQPVRTRSVASTATWTVPSRRLRGLPSWLAAQAQARRWAGIRRARVQVTNDGRFLIAVDAGSNQLSVLRIHFDGSLHLVPNGVVSSDGPTPVSVAEHDGLVYVANAAAVGPNYTGFTLSPSGQLQPLANSTVPLPDGSQPGDILFNSTGTNLVGTRVGTSEIDSFAVGRNGLLTEARWRARSPLRGLGPSAVSFGRPIPSSCSSPTPTTELVLGRCPLTASPSTGH